jgi:formate-dependent nitrite reductase membrane component NrfD
MPEITLTGVNGITFPIMNTWGWEVALDLFFGGLVAGLLIFGSVLRLRYPQGFPRTLFWVDLLGFPLLSAGMFLLLLDLSNKINLWRFYVTFQPTSAMSWGAWMLLFTMIVLTLRFAARVSTPAFLANTLAPVRLWTEHFDRALAMAGILLGAGVGLYTGELLSSIAARPLWNTAVLAPLFLVSGLGTGGALLWLLAPKEERAHLMPATLALWVVELVLVCTFAINLAFGSLASQRAASLLFGASLGATFWGLVVLLGLVVPIALSGLEKIQRRLTFGALPPILKLTGGLALRFVIVYAGLSSFL